MAISFAPLTENSLVFTLSLKMPSAACFVRKCLNKLQDVHRLMDLVPANKTLQLVTYLQSENFLV